MINIDSGFLVYKCRKCGKEIKSVHVPDGAIALSVIMFDNPTPKSWGVMVAGKTDVHSCGDGSLGVGDLIGFEKDK